MFSSSREYRKANVLSFGGLCLALPRQELQRTTIASGGPQNLFSLSGRYSASILRSAGYIEAQGSCATFWQPPPCSFAIPWQTMRPPGVRSFSLLLFPRPRGSRCHRYIQETEGDPGPESFPRPCRTASRRPPDFVSGASSAVGGNLTWGMIRRTPGPEKESCGQAPASALIKGPRSFASDAYTTQQRDSHTTVPSVASQGCVAVRGLRWTCRSVRRTSSERVQLHSPLGSKPTEPAP